MPLQGIRGVFALFFPTACLFLEIRFHLTFAPISYLFCNVFGIENLRDSTRKSLLAVAAAGTDSKR